MIVPGRASAVFFGDACSRSATKLFKESLTEP